MKSIAGSMLRSAIPTLLIAALAAAFNSTWVSWYPPGALILPAYPYNATHFSAYIGTNSIYIVQEGLSFMGAKAEAQAALQFLYSTCKYVAVVPLDVVWIGQYQQVWVSDVYCGNGTMWIWLKWLPLRFAFYAANITFVNATNATVVTPIGTFVGAIPAGWYYDPSTGQVFRLPGSNASLILELDEMRATIAALQTQLAALAANKTALQSALAQLQTQLNQLQRQQQALQSTLAQKDSQIQALQSALQAAQQQSSMLQTQLNTARAQLQELNQTCIARMQAINQTWAAKLNQLQLQLQAMVQTQSGGWSGNFNLLVILAVALAGVIASLIVYRRRRGE